MAHCFRDSLGIAGNSSRVVYTSWHIVGAVLREGLWNKEEVKVRVIMKAGGNEEAIQRREEAVLMSQVSGSACSRRLPLPHCSQWCQL